MRQEELKQMYGAVPNSFRHRVAFALKRTEERTMKRRITFRTALIAAALLIALTAAAYAAFSSQVIAFFGKQYGEDMKQWLEKGDVGTVNHKFVLDEVEFTLDEVVYRENSLFGVGTIRPAEGSRALLIGADHLPDEPFGYDVYGESGRREEAPLGSPTIADVAKETGGRLLRVYATPERIGVDGGTMLSAGDLGFSQVPQWDGSLRFSFEIRGSMAVEKGDVYTLEMSASVCEMMPEGTLIRDTLRSENWTIQTKVTPMSETAPVTAKQPEPVNPAEPVQPGKPEIIVPDAYTQTGTLPIYRATARDFSKQLQPELFNQSGIASRNKGSIVFKDEAILQFGPEALFYWENSGTFNANANAGTSSKADIIPCPALSHAIASLAAWGINGRQEDSKLYQPEKTALSHISLDEAKKTLETLLERLGVTGYVFDYALDMSVERIQALDAEQNARIAAGTLRTNLPPYDFTQISAADEGFYLSYHKPGNGRGQGNGDIFSVYAYVTGRGVVEAAIRDMYIPGDVYDTPQTLVRPEDILARLPQEVAASRFPEKVASVSSMRLTYSPVRAANKADGMVLTPVWLVIYQDEQAAAQNYTCWAEFDAVDGKLLSAIFK